MIRIRQVALMAGLLLVCASGVAADAAEAVYQQRCAACHTGDGKDAGPVLASLRQMGWRQVYLALTEGKMKVHAESLSTEALRDLTTYVSGGRRGGSGRGSDWQPGADAFCQDRSIDFAPRVSAWGLDLANSRFQPNSQINRKNVDQLKLKWVFGMPDTSEMRSHPVITPDGPHICVPTLFL